MMKHIDDGVTVTVLVLHYCIFVLCVFTVFMLLISEKRNVIFVALFVGAAE